MLGRDVVDVLARRRADLRAPAREDLDITDAAAVAAAVANADVVVNAAAWTDVDGAETAEDAATRVNGDGVRMLAEACAASGARLLHVSTEYVFAGDAATPYAEDAPPAPRSAYGRSKLVGEQAVRELLPDRGYVVRTAWLYGEHGASFVRTMIRLSRERERLDVVDDQRGQPTWSRDVATRLVELGGRPDAPAGTYHATSSGETTWCGLARAVFENLGEDPDRVRPTTTDRFPRPAPRPAYSVLGHEGWAEVGMAPLRPWRDALREALPAIVRGGG